MRVEKWPHEEAPRAVRPSGSKLVSHRVQRALSMEPSRPEASRWSNATSGRLAGRQVTRRTNEWCDLLGLLSFATSGANARTVRMHGDVCAPRAVSARRRTSERADRPECVRSSTEHKLRGVALARAQGVPFFLSSSWLAFQVSPKFAKKRERGKKSANLNFVAPTKWTEARRHSANSSVRSVGRPSFKVNKRAHCTHTPRCSARPPDSLGRPLSSANGRGWPIERRPAVSSRPQQASQAVGRRRRALVAG